MAQWLNTFAPALWTQCSLSSGLHTPPIECGMHSDNSQATMELLLISFPHIPVFHSFLTGYRDRSVLVTTVPLACDWAQNLICLGKCLNNYESTPSLCTRY